ncbi:MAG TPA: TonB-dependent receptor [Longimicrobiales bacterium]|nr:TonB-dependent receptor [Longimicrobiales bacterium]
MSRVAVLLLLLAAGALPVRAGQTDGHGELRTDHRHAPADSATIDGVVLDSATRRPLVGANVRVVALARQDVTHDGGEFHLTNLPAGRHTVVVERLGYRREVRDVQLAAGQSLTLRIAMQASAIELPGIVVTGTPRASLGDETVRPANVLSGQELARKLDVTLATTLQTEPGLAVTSVGPATARPVIRGLGGDRVLILEDGARVGDLSSSSSDHAVSSDPLNAQRIEVVRGPAALLYGSNAIGGVINIIREEVPLTAYERPAGVLSVQAQSVNKGIAGGTSGQATIGTVALRGEGSYRRGGDLSTPAGELPNTQLRTYSLSAGASHFARWGHFGAAYRYYDNAYGIPALPEAVGLHPEGVTIEMRRHGIHGEAMIVRPIGPVTGIDIDGKYTNYYHSELESDGTLGTEFGLLTGAGELRARHEAWGPFDNGAIGTRVSWQDYAAGGSSATPPSQEWTAAAYIFEEISSGRFRLQGGARYDWHRIEPLDTTTELMIGDVRTRTFGSVSASLGALLALARGVSIGASVARAYRTPAISELFSQGPHLAAYSFEIGNPDLDAETGVGIDAFVRVGHARYNAELALYRNALDNFIYYRATGEPSPTGLPVYQAFGTDALLEGYEVSGDAEIVRHLVVNGVLSYVRGTITSTDQPLPMIPPLHGQLSVRYERPAYFVGVSWRGAARQDRLGEFETETAGYNVIDMDGGFRWVAFDRVQSVTLRLDNLTDEFVYDHLSRVKDIMPGAGFGASMIYRVVF